MKLRFDVGWYQPNNITSWLDSTLCQRLLTESVWYHSLPLSILHQYESVRKKTLKPRQISLAKICTTLFSIPRNALSDSRHKHEGKCVPVWVTKNDIVWQAAIAHHAYYCTAAFWSEGKLANEYTWPFTANISWTHVWWG
jgi:hypothetical protein